MKTPIIGITCGDLNGIGLEIILKTLSNPEVFEKAISVVFASRQAVSSYQKIIGREDFRFHFCENWDDLQTGKPNLMEVWKEDVFLELGKENKAVGKFAFQSLQAAVDFYKKGKIDAILTAPIHKNNIQSADFQFTGHTDYLENRFGGKAVMLLASDQMRMALATVHIPLREVPHQISKENIGKKLRILDKSLREDFQIKNPKIAVLALNPHAGDGGVIGQEDDEMVAPAILQNSQKGIAAHGPFSADSFFGAGKHKDFDAILAMYHDQGLIPFKALSFGKGVNVTIGLPVIRTSPDHGTAFDIAGKNVADEGSFREAFLLAAELARANRR